MTSQGTAHGRFTLAIQRRNVFQAELALREMRDPWLLVLLDYLERRWFPLVGPAESTGVDPGGRE